MPSEHPFVPYDEAWASGDVGRWCRAHQDAVERLYTRLHQETHQTLGARAARRLDIASFGAFMARALQPDGTRSPRRARSPPARGDQGGDRDDASAD